jgi:trehalose synthase
MVNAVQRRADVIVRKTLAEGFGLTVAEAMWKARARSWSVAWGVQNQIRHGRSGLLLEDPSDPVGFGRAVRTLLTDRDRRSGWARRRTAAPADPGAGPHRAGRGLNASRGAKGGV